MPKTRRTVPCVSEEQRRRASVETTCSEVANTSGVDPKCLGPLSHLAYLLKRCTRRQRRLTQLTRIHKAAYLVRATPISSLIRDYQCWCAENLHLTRNILFSTSHATTLCNHTISTYLLVPIAHMGTMLTATPGTALGSADDWSVSRALCFPHARSCLAPQFRSHFASLLSLRSSLETLCCVAPVRSLSTSSIHSAAPSLLRCANSSCFLAPLRSLSALYQLPFAQVALCSAQSCCSNR